MAAGVSPIDAANAEHPLAEKSGEEPLLLEGSAVIRTSNRAA